MERGGGGRRGGEVEGRRGVVCDAVRDVGCPGLGTNTRSMARAHLAIPAQALRLSPTVAQVSKHPL